MPKTSKKPCVTRAPGTDCGSEPLVAVVNVKPNGSAAAITSMVRV
jgi:hypothetical protein